MGILPSIDLPRDPKNWHRRFVTFWLALRRLLPLLAVLSLALMPVTASAAAAGMHASMTAQAHGAMDMAGMDMDDMPCCPPEKAGKPDCAKAGCPLPALCLAHMASVLPTTVLIPAPIVTRTSRAWPGAASFASVHGPPLAEPPRA